MFKCEYWDYFDVYETPEEGYTVNNLCCMYENVTLENLENETLINYLKKKEYFQETANTETISILDFYPYLELEEASTGYPIGRFYIIED